MKRLTTIMLTLVLALALTACSKASTTEDNTVSASVASESEVQVQPNSTVSDTPREIDLAEVKKYLKDNYGKVTIDGSTSMIPLHQSLNTVFGFSEDVGHNRTVDAFEKFISGENDILLGVDYSDELLAKAKNSGIELVKEEITREAFVFLINKNNPVQNLTISQIKDIYSGKITNWSEVGGDNAPIQAFQRNADSGSQIRMNKFMGDMRLMEQDVKYYQGMGDIVEAIANYDEGKYSLAYNMYTFTEKQYANEDVVLLNVGGVHPTDETIFDETYPIVIYNYVYHDANNAFASEFASNLYAYLMSDEGQKLISESGYVNLNHQYDRNKNIDSPYDYDDSNETRFGFYDKEKGEFYNADDDGNLLVFKNYADYVLRDTKHKDNAKAREFLTRIVDSDIPMQPRTSVLIEETGIIMFNPWWDASLDPDDFFNFKYQDKYYSSLEYSIDTDKYILAASYGQEAFDGYASSLLNGFSEYAVYYAMGETIELAREDLSNLYLRKNEYDATVNGVKVNEYSYDQKDLKIELEYYKPFE